MSSGPKVDIAKGTEGGQIDFEQFISEIKAKENEERVEKEIAGASSSDIYFLTDSLRNHIENAEAVTSGRAGIKGAHNRKNFLRAIKDTGAQITGKEANSQMSGIEKLSYRMPKKDARGKNTGEYQSRTWTKTVYDPSQISTDEYISRGLQAANNVARKSPDKKVRREWVGVDDKGVRWHGYCNSDGDITSFYPDD